MYANASRRYTDDGVITASPGRLLTMLYDRLVLDLTRGENAQRAGDLSTAHTNLVHAQDIITELRATLKLDAWEGAAGLSGLYAWWLTELLGANVRKEPDRTAAVRRQAESLRDAWHEAVKASAPALATA